MTIDIPYILSILMYGVAGVCLCVMMLNRRLILIPDSRAKVSSIIIFFILFGGGSVTAGFHFPEKPWIFIPAGIICLVLIGEIRRLIIRRISAASPPVDTIPHAVEISSPLTTTDLVCHRYKISFPNWRGPSFRIVQLTDMHVNSNIPTEYYEKVVRVAEEEKADFIFLTGDFLTETKHIDILKKILPATPKQPTFAVLGNHDYWTDPDAVLNMLADRGITTLSNDSKIVELSGHKISITGYDYPWGTKDKTIAENDGAELHLVLSHTPDNIYRLAKSSADAVFSGHYHAGQIRLPFFGSIVIPSIYGRRFDHGHFVVKGTHLFVPSGIGAASPPFRVYCKPDLFVIEIEAAHGSER